jgi:uncharacterized membrane protein YqgA involved in biofilm formation
MQRRAAPWLSRDGHAASRRGQILATLEDSPILGEPDAVSGIILIALVLKLLEMRDLRVHPASGASLRPALRLGSPIS